MRRRPTSRRAGVAVALGALLGSLLAGCGDAEPARTASAPALPFVNTTAGTAPASSWRPVFADDFSGTRLDRAKWRTRVQPRGGSRRCASPSPRMVRVRDGQVRLRVEKVRARTPRCPHGVWQNAMIGTGESADPGFATTYGMFAARVRFQHGQGQHGSFWIQGTGADSAEIDAVEYFGDGHDDGGTSNLIHQRDAQGGLVSVGGRRSEVPAALGPGETPSNGWHVWSVEWSPAGYVFRLDDHVTMRTSRNRTSQREFLVLSLLTSDWELPYLEDASSAMRVDWVRVWERR